MAAFFDFTTPYDFAPLPAGITNSAGFVDLLAGRPTICEAAQRPSMRFVAVKSEEQQAAGLVFRPVIFGAAANPADQRDPRPSH